MPSPCRLALPLLHLIPQRKQRECTCNRVLGGGTFPNRFGAGCMSQNRTLRKPAPQGCRRQQAGTLRVNRIGCDWSPLAEPPSAITIALTVSLTLCRKARAMEAWLGVTHGPGPRISAPLVPSSLSPVSPLSSVSSVSSISFITEHWMKFFSGDADARQRPLCKTGAWMRKVPGSREAGLDCRLA